MSRTVIDFHTHAFPDALAPRAIAALAANAAVCGYVPHTDGTIGGLIASMDSGGVSRSVVCNIATNARQMSKVNDFAIFQLKNPRLLPLGSVHPDASYAEMQSELARLTAAGIRGIKLHPDYVGMELTAPAFAPILGLCEQMGLFAVTHAGFDPVSPDHTFCTPDMILQVLGDYPGLRLVAAHTGGFDREDEVLAKLCGTRVYLDTSLSAVRHAKDPAWGEKCAAIIRAHDPSRILFATDNPWSTPEDELTFIHSLGLPDTVLDMILHQNAVALLERGC